MFLIRESFEEDVDQILEIAHHLDTVNLPADRSAIERILARSSQSFREILEPSEREYLFVLEDMSSGKLIGTSMIHGQHGTRRSPHVFFQLFEDERYSETLDRYAVHECLRLAYNYNGPSEIGGLILFPDYRGHEDKLGRLLSYVRFLFIAMHRPVFRDEVLSELLPPLEPDGTSRLWKCLGRRFTGLTYPEADRLSKDNKEFIKSLFPHGMIYTSLLPDGVREIIGVVGPETRGVEKMLRRIGFEFAKTIDPFDGGPHFIAKTDDITLVDGARKVTVEVGTPPSSDNMAWAIVASERPRDKEPPWFRAVVAHIAPPEQGRPVVINQDVHKALGIEPGVDVWAVVP